MKLLAFDTTEEACSAALHVDDGQIFRYALAPRRHSELILPMIDELLEEAGLSIRQLDGLAFSRGPGSFTGVRIATGVAQGIALGADLPVVPVSSLQALAQGVYREYGHSAVLSVLDARMAEVYWGQYALEDGIMQSPGTDQLGRPEAIHLISADVEAGAGSGWETYAEVLTDVLEVKPVYPQQRIHAQDVASIGVVAFDAGRALPVEQALPVYLRDTVAQKPGFDKVKG